MRTIRAALPIILMMGLVSCSTTVDDLGIAFGKWAISEARYERLVGPSNKLLEIHSATFAGDRNAEIEKMLEDVLRDVRYQIYRLDQTNIETLTAHESLPEISIDLVISEEPYALAVQGSRPRIEISTQLIKNLMHPYFQFLSEFQQIDDPFERRWESYSLEATKVEIYEGLVFVIAHEVTHIWLDKKNERSIESEIRADSYAVLISSELSLAADFRRKAIAELERTNSFHTSDPIAFIMMRVEIGGEVMLNVYRDSRFSEGNSTHLSIEERITLVKRDLDKIIDKRVEETTVLESAFWALSNEILFE